MTPREIFDKEKGYPTCVDNCDTCIISKSQPIRLCEREYEYVKWLEEKCILLTSECNTESE